MSPTKTAARTTRKRRPRVVKPPTPETDAASQPVDQMTPNAAPDSVKPEKDDHGPVTAFAFNCDLPETPGNDRVRDSSKPVSAWSYNPPDGD